MDKDNVIALEKLASSDADLLTELLRKGAQRLIYQAVALEFEGCLSEHSDRKTAEGRAAVIRNGHLPERLLQTGIGPVTVKIPKARSKDGTLVTFRSALVPPYVRKTKSLEAALPWLYLKGISSGEMGAALEVLVGPAAKGLSASTVCRLKQAWAEEYKAWSERRLDDRRWVYVWADGIYSGLRAEGAKLCALVIIGVDERGEKHFLAIVEGVRESTQSWREVLLALKARGLRGPRLAVGDGALGFWAALDEIFPGARHQRCWMHKTGNVLNYLSKSSQPNAKQGLHNIWQAETKQSAERAFDLFIKTYQDKYPKATHCLLKDREVLLNFYDFPATHWQSIRTTNPIESAFGTIRHRTRGTKGCLSRETMLQMLFKLGLSAEKNWIKLRGFHHLAKVIDGVKFKDGEEVTTNESAAA